MVIEKYGLSAAQRCDCELAERSYLLEQKAQIPPLYQASSFDNFSTRHEMLASEQALKQVMQIVRGYVREYPNVEQPGLLFIGSPGVGKTHLAVAALRRLIERGFEGKFFDYQNLLERIRSSYDPLSGQADREAFRTALEAEVLLLDDLGAHRVTDWVEDTITSLVTYRCNHKLPLIATTNLPDADMNFQQTDRDSVSPGGKAYGYTLGDRVGMRARSRLFEMCRVIRMPEVGDFRMRKNMRRIEGASA